MSKGRSNRCVLVSIEPQQLALWSPRSPATIPTAKQVPCSCRTHQTSPNTNPCLFAIHGSLQAAAVDAAIAAGSSPGLLAGVPIAIKDNICTEGVRTTAGSRILDTYTPPYDATAVAKLRAAGAVLIGKTNMDEFGMGSTTENSAYQVRGSSSC